MNDTRRTLAAVLRTDLGAFTEKVFQLINPGARYYPNWHIDTMAYHLQETVKGNITRLIITVPPRQLKSTLASVALPAFILGNDPSKNVICASYSEKLAGKLALDFRTIVRSGWYRDTFPGMRVDRRKNTELELVTTRNGGRLSTSVEGTMTGRGGDFIIIDDPIKPDEAMSEADRNRTNEWFTRTVYSRLNNRKTGVIIIVMQRLHEDDLVGHVMDLDDWTVVNIPAIAPEELRYRYGDGKEQVFVRPKGSLIDPGREDVTELDKVRHALGTRIFETQYQQNPMPDEGNLVRRKWFRFYDDPPMDNQLDAIVHSWDTASAAGELNDYSVCTVWGICFREDGTMAFFLLDVFREKLDYPDLRNHALELAVRDRPQVILIENKGTGQTLSQDLRKEKKWFVRPLSPKGDKVTRMSGQAALIEQGLVFLPHEAPWLGAFLKEVLSFPGARHDDQVDSLELFLRSMRHPRGIYQGVRKDDGVRKGPRRRLGKPRPKGKTQSPSGSRKYSLGEMIESVQRRKFG